MTIRDTKTLINIICNKNNLGLPINASVNKEFENKLRHKNYFFSNGIDIVHEFFNFERKIDSSFISKSIQMLGKHPIINKLLINVADNGIGN